MIYTNIIAYEHCPDKKTINEIKKRGYDVLIQKSDNLSEEIIRLEGVSIIENNKFTKN